jgi:predicted CXXCH cytochrome family protein
VCHPAERVQLDLSPHAREDVRCVSCHGGDDRTLDQKLAHGGNYRGRLKRAEIPRVCAACHADEERMRAYNLPVDQYALYQTSGHGRRLAGGDTRVAVCSDCHGAHDILPPADPASRVFVLNIPKTCGRCHGDTRVVRHDVYQDYMSSIHASELIEKGNQRAPTCVSCHGVHGAAPPAVGDVDKVCGQCHTAERRYFVAGPHKAGLDLAHQAECVSCHGNHAVAKSRPERLASSCSACHAEDAPQIALGQRLWTEYRTAAAELGKAASLVAQADAVPLNTDDYRARLEEARTYLSETMPAAHAVREDIVAGLAARARSVGSEVEHEIYSKLGELRLRRLLLVVFWFYLLLTVLVIRRYWRGEHRAR